MRLIIAGSRTILPDMDEIHRMARAFNKTVTRIVSGGAVGVDQAGEAYARLRGLPLDVFPVTPNDWKRHGKQAGILRNITMAQHGDALLAYHDGVSPGTKHMITESLHRGLEVIVVYRTQS